MNWDQDMTIVDGRMYAGDKWLGEFSSHQAALTALKIMRDSGPSPSADDGKILTRLDLDLMAVIDADC